MPRDLSPFIATASNQVKFACKRDEDAVRIAAVLHALGFAPQRVLTSPPTEQQLQAALDRVLQRHGVTAHRERVIAQLLLHGFRSDTELHLYFSDIDPTTPAPSEQTCKWLKRTLLTRCQVTDADTFVDLVRAELGELAEKRSQ